MRQARGLLPYAAVAVLIVGATVVTLVVTTLGAPVTPTASATPARSTVPTAAARPATDLSPNGRIAYWRVEANGDFTLSLANADNSRRRGVAKTDQPPQQVTKTKWAADGGAVAYIEAGVRLVVVRLDGGTTAYTLAPDVRADGYRIVDHRFSPSGARIAATVQRTTSSQSDVYVSGPGGTWTRLTATEDVIAADWISDDELLVQTTGGIVGRLLASGHDQLRPLTGLAGATPIIGEDGRVYFLSGRVSPFAGAAETLVFAASAGVWSMTADGEDLRRETIALDTDSFRLDGQWPGGFLLHRGTNPAQVGFTRAGPVDLPTSAGLIERVAVAADHRFAIGFASTNILRLDLTPSGAVAATTVLLGSVVQGDVWFPRAVSLVRIAPARPDVPAARYVFALGGHLWTMGQDGVASLLRAGNTSGNTLRRFNLPPPMWSNTGDRVLTTEAFASGTSVSQLVAVSIARDGTIHRYATPSSVAPLVTWSPDASQLAVVALPAAATDPAVLASDLTVTLVDATTGATRATMPGREAYWTAAGVVVLGNGTFRTGDRARDAQALELWTNGTRKDVIAVAKLVSDPRTEAPAQARGITQTSALTASQDGAYASVHLAFLGISPVPIAYAIVRTRDGAPTLIVAGDAVSDEAWMPGGKLVGYTLTSGPVGAASRQRVVVRDAGTGDVVLEQDGRFAGWSPDGTAIYIAKSEGLYARRVAGGEAQRFAPYGVVVSATKP